MIAMATFCSLTISVHIKVFRNVLFEEIAVLYLEVRKYKIAYKIYTVSKAVFSGLCQE